MLFIAQAKPFAVLFSESAIFHLPILDSADKITQKWRNSLNSIVKMCFFCKKTGTHRFLLMKIE